MKEETILQPECYKRHAEIDNHIKEGRFWRKTIIGIALTGSAILIGQYNMSIENDKKMIAANAKLTQMVEINTRRLDKIEDWAFLIKGDKGDRGATGATGARGEAGKDK
jgi:hypothetical protein